VQRQETVQNIGEGQVQARSWRRRVWRLTSEPGGERRRGERGAAAVEFALLLPLLMLFLFGIIQYGYGLFQLQAFNSSLGDATQVAADGVTNCSLFPNVLKDLADGNGLDPADVSDVHVIWQKADGTASTSGPVQLGRVEVSATFTPFKIGLPFVPFPDTITRKQTANVQDVGQNPLTGAPVGNC
jgi:Flp pilus assembly pilin Flp